MAGFDGICRDGLCFLQRDHQILTVQTRTTHTPMLLHPSVSEAGRLSILSAEDSTSPQMSLRRVRTLPGPYGLLKLRE